MMSVSHRSFARALVLACIGVMPALTWAQSGSAAIAGTIRDTSGRPIAEVSVRLDDPDTGSTREMTSGAAGQFEFGGLLPASRFTLQVEFAGFRAARRALDPLTAGERRLIDIHLEPAGISEAVVVTSDGPLGRTASPELGGNLGREQLDRLPANGRDLIALAYLIPGAAPARGFYNLAPRLTMLSDTPDIVKSNTWGAALERICTWALRSSGGIVQFPCASVRGALWGVGLCMVAQVIVMPMMGGRLFSSAAGGLMTVMGSLVGHVIYGSVLGSIASAPVGTRVAHA